MRDRIICPACGRECYMAQQNTTARDPARTMIDAEVPVVRIEGESNPVSGDPYYTPVQDYAVPHVYTCPHSSQMAIQMRRKRTAQDPS